MARTPNAGTEGGFEPPNYIASLIAAINDGAKAAQSGVLLYLLVALSLLATVFSTSDEDLLRNKTITIAQIGASLPPSFSFALAPLVFVFLHVYTLTRFDMLAKNLRHFVAELPRMVRRPSQQEHCRQLLANTEFVLVFAAPRESGSPLHAFAWRWMVRGLLAMLPVLVLFIVQIDALRYQSVAIVWAQRIWTVVDLAAIIWFFSRNRLTPAPAPRTAPGWIARLATVSPITLALLLFNVSYCGVVPADADVWAVRYTGIDLPSWYHIDREGDFAAQRPLLSGILSHLTLYPVSVVDAVPAIAWVEDLIRQPLDTFLCPQLGFGCRYLRVERRTVIEHVWDDKAVAGLRGDKPDYAGLLLGIEGIDLRDRALRFAVLDDSRLPAADLVGAKLTKASLKRTLLPGALGFGAQLAGTDLSEAQLAGADLSEAQLAGADLLEAQLAGADLYHAQLAGADLRLAQLAGADLLDAQLAGADLSHARLAGADLSEEAQLAGADLSGAQLAGADLRFAGLAGADLSHAQLAGADLSGAQLAGADLHFAQLAGADLSGAWLAGAELSNARARNVVSTQETTFALLDARGLAFEPPDDEDTKSWREAIAAIPDPGKRDNARQRLKRALSDPDPKWRLQFTASDKEKLLVSSLNDPAFAAHPEWLTTQADAVYRSGLANLLSDLAHTYPQAVNTIIWRAESYANSSDDAATGIEIACRLLDAADAKPAQVSLSDSNRRNLTLLTDQHRKCDKPVAAP